MSNPFDQFDTEQSNPFDQFDEQKPKKEEGWGTRVASDIGERFEKIKTSVPEGLAPFRGERALFRIGGQIAGAANDVIGQTLKSAYKTIVPEKAQRVISEAAGNVMESPYVQEPIKAGAELYGKFKETFPEAAKDVEAGANIAGFLPIGKGASLANMARKEGVNIFQDVVMPQTKEAVANEINKTIRYGVEKAIRPPVSKGKNFAQAKQYFDKATSAVKEIVANKENLVLTDVEGKILKGKLPQSLKQFSDAIDQTKRAIFTKYDDMAREAGENGAIVDLTKTAKELDSFSSSSVLQDLSPEVAKYANKRAESFLNRGAYTSTEAQDAITHLNKSLEAFYRNPSYETASRAGVDALIANNLRKSLDEAIENTVGEGYQSFKKAYGSLKTIEDDVAKRAMVDARKSVHGLLDFTDIFTSGELLAGIATMNPAMVMRAGAWKAVKEYFKHINNPNRVVKMMFNDIDNIIKNDVTGFKSQTLKNSSFLNNIDDVLGKNVTGNASVKTPKGPTKSPKSEYQGKFTIKRKALPEGQGFELKDKPYTPDVIDAIFTAKSRPIESLPPVNADEVLQLPYQGFEAAIGTPLISNAKMRRMFNEIDEEDYLKGLRNTNRYIRR